MPPYMVLARKWRPNTFAGLVGQDHVARTLGNAVTSGRIPQALLFSGPRGVGKTSVARIFAKSLNCNTGITTEPCGECSACIEIAQGIHPDVLEMDGASNNSVNDVRNLIDHIKYVPTGGRYKIYLIDEVHMLSQGAFNALLKTLEEPPPHGVFVFATTELRKVPATIISRCQHFDFHLVATADIFAHLQKICAAEGFSLEEAALQVVAREARRQPARRFEPARSGNLLRRRGHRERR